MIKVLITIGNIREEIEPGVSYLTMIYCYIFFWLLSMNYFLEGFWITNLLYVIAHPFIIYSEWINDFDHMSYGIAGFMILSMLGLTFMISVSESDNVPVRGEYDVGYK